MWAAWATMVPLWQYLPEAYEARPRQQTNLMTTEQLQALARGEPVREAGGTWTTTTDGVTITWHHELDTPETDLDAAMGEKSDGKPKIDRFLSGDKGCFS